MAELEGLLRASTTADAAAQTGVTLLDLEAMEDQLLLSAVGALDDSSRMIQGDGGASFWQQGQDGQWFLMDPPPCVFMSPPRTPSDSSA